MDFKAALIQVRQFAVRRRVILNRLFFVLILLFLAHPRNRTFFGLGFLVGLVGSLLRVWAKGTLVKGGATLTIAGPYRFFRHPIYI